MDSYAAWSEAEASNLIASYATREGGLMPALHALQERFGCVPVEAVPVLARAFNLSRADVHGTISFYHDFRRRPPGARVLRLCRAESCQARGCERVASELREALGVDWGETTGDGRLTLEPAYCLGLCAVSPAALLDGVPMGRIDAAGLRAAIEEARA